MLRAVIDTSCLVSDVLTPGDVMRRVMVHWRNNRFVLLASPQTRAELAGVLARPRIQRLTTVPLDPMIEGLARYTWHVPGALDLTGACRDPQDDKFLACAVEGRAHYLVTGDRDLLSMKTYQGVAIVNPGQFLLALELHRLDAEAMAARFDAATLRAIEVSLPLEAETASRVRVALALPAQHA